MTRYITISAIAGALDFLLALLFLHAGLRPWLAIALAMLISGSIDYFALEWWGFPKRAGTVSFTRLAESCFVELGTYFLRLALLHVWKLYFQDIDPTEHLTGLAVSYAFSAIFGYLLRTKIIFANPGKK